MSTHANRGVAATMVAIALAGGAKGQRGLEAPDAPKNWVYPWTDNACPSDRSPLYG